MYLLKEVYKELVDVIFDSKVEQGFILGSSENIECVNHSFHIPAIAETKYYYEADYNKANQIIKNWYRQGICFTGFIHSHPMGCINFSNSDLVFAGKLLDCFDMPFLWFGLIVDTEKTPEIKFFKIWKESGSLHFHDEKIEIVN